MTTRPIDPVPARTAFARFRVASIVEGIALLILVAIMVMKYLVLPGDPTWERISSMWSPIHGVIYFVYVVLGFDLWSKMRWGLPRMLLLMLFGVVPVLSFVGERWTHARMEEDLADRRIPS
ncbi:DUF3817 domain-containing protein [Brachybacterium sp. EF45031]|uniref:DUF3817 domain-containing protein n=1 Tax=Brachybacterium sillae TaxID=2810536 RepID=UPI00217E6F85|nr:DUF3817 domain-containing protein [Brachybacterium sillae]MCS6711358.1 DUF3817 domain-containing protein [Brachybacterium sillae]